MMTNFRTMLWATNAIMLALVAYTASVTTAMLLEKYLVVNTPPQVLRGPADSGNRVREKLPYSAFQAILDTNMFRAERRQIELTSAPTPDSPQRTAQPEKLALVLKGTFVASPYGFAFVSGSNGKNERLYRTGGCIPLLGDQEIPPCLPGQGVLKTVKQDHILVTYRGQEIAYELTSLPSNRAQRSTTRSARRPPALNKGRKINIGASKSAPFPNTRNGTNIEYRVPGEEVEKAFENFTEIIKQARVVPYSVNGKPQGFKIMRIRNQSIFQRLGLANGDIIQQVNGEPLVSADQALRLFTLFQNEREVVLEIQRKKENLTLTYIIE